MTNDSPKILILRGGAIGDFIMTLPALRALRDRWPGAWIELIGYPHVARLAARAGLVNRVQSLDQARMARFFALRPDFDEDQREYIKGFNIVISYLHDPSGMVKSNLEAAGGRHVICGSPIIGEGHAADQLIKPLESLAIYCDNPVPTLELDAIREAVYPSRTIIIQPGSGSMAKNWPLRNYLQLAEAIPTGIKGAEVVFLLGEAEVQIRKQLSDLNPSIPVASGLELEEVAEFLSKAKAYVGNDSGITHIAAAVGAPVLALFGPTNPAQWCPRGSRSRILKSADGRMESISVGEAMSALVGLLTNDS